MSIDQGIGQVGVAGTRSVSPASTTVYTLTATNSAGAATGSATVAVNSAPPAGTGPVIVEFSSNLNSDGTSTLGWNVTGADQVSIDQGVGIVNATGSRLVSPASSTTYTLTATNSAGIVTRSVTTTQPPIIAFSTYLNPDGTSTLSWNVTGADQVSIDQNIGIVAASGTKIVSPVTNTIYTLTATWAKKNWSNDIGTESRSVTVYSKPTTTPWVQ